MKSLFIMLAVGFLGLTLITADAEARRFGGGKSLGRNAPSFFQKKPPQKAAPQGQQQQLGNTRSSGASRWLGPLAGLAAGGLLAALLFGDGFEGFQFLDFLLIAALVIGAVMLFRARRTPSSPSRAYQAPAAAGAAGATSAPARFETPEIGSNLGGASTSAATANLHQRPAWFDEEAFLHAAKTHFIRLQAAWDVGDMKDIRDYTTPELFAELTLERQSYNGEPQFTEVVSVEATLLDLVTEGEQVVAGVRYSGMIREDKGADAHPFSEVWYIQRALNDPEASWYVAGIEQEHRGS